MLRCRVSLAIGLWRRVPGAMQVVGAFRSQVAAPAVWVLERAVIVADAPQRPIQLPRIYWIELTGEFRGCGRAHLFAISYAPEHAADVNVRLHLPDLPRGGESAAVGLQNSLADVPLHFAEGGGL